MNVRREFFRYVIPSMLSFALSGIYAIADGFFVGNALGDQALAAINIAYPITAFLNAVGTGIGMGGAVEYAICGGNGQHKKQKQYIAVSILLLLLASAFATVGLILGAESLLRLFGAQGEILSLGQGYMRYIAFGAAFQILGTGMVPFIRNMGGAFAAMIAMIAGFVTNILLDYLFVWHWEFGMQGAAIATDIGQAVTLGVCLVYMIRARELSGLGLGRSVLQCAGAVLAVGLSPFGLTFSPNITLILVNKSAVLYGGNDAVACYATISYISSIIFLLIQGISDGGQPLISRSFGKGSIREVKTLRRLAYSFGIAVAAVCMAVLFLSRGNIAKIFGASDQVVTATGEILPIFIIGYFFVAVSRITTSYLYAIKYNSVAYCLIYGEPAALFLLLMILPHFCGITGTWISVPVSQAVIALAGVVLMLANRRTIRERIEQNSFEV